MNIKKEENNKVFKIYFLWKELNTLAKEIYPRGINLHESITENLCCIINGYKLHASEGGSEDAITKDNKKVQIKGTSNFNDDLTSFGPRSEFDILEFLRLDQKEDKFYCYRINLEELRKIKVNETETFHDKQLTGQRPRFSIIKKIIKTKQYKEYAIIDMKTGEVKFN